HGRRGARPRRVGPGARFRVAPAPAARAVSVGDPGGPDAARRRAADARPPRRLGARPRHQRVRHVLRRAGHHRRAHRPAGGGDVAARVHRGQPVRRGERRRGGRLDGLGARLRAAARRPQRRLRRRHGPDARQAPAGPAPAGGAARHRRDDGDGHRPARRSPAGAHVLGHRRVGLRVLERRHAARRAGRRRHRRPRGARARRRLPRGVRRPRRPPPATAGGAGGGRRRRARRAGADPPGTGRAADHRRRAGRRPRPALRPPGGAVSWWPLLGLAAGAYGLKVVGLVLLGPRATDGRALRLAALLPAALLPALVVVNTLGGDRRIVVDARAAGLAVAVALVAGSRGRAPFVLVVVAAAAVTALVRAAG